ncbi:protein phosphatase 2C domain-containing protein [Labilibaculum sp. DW002]|uniref:Protein phosphatase 2C domain-containing protein n=1 Tax=Paralabilibaculum antarcticum TaxID=2912572 RepID=A0ABT5VMU9_9BACT|nr:protein phosphatase 2C domain-containing protein [Labilibaculum sp. DW002]MDE5416754.1 protein phosphatase 2C domain-containing protein [Labilibaculum sp. DW002]
MIYTSTVSRRGTSHPDWNEDNFFINEMDKVIVGAVFDGCSSGKDSFFASKLFANILNKTVEEVDFRLEIETFPTLVHRFCKNLNKAIKAIGLTIDESLSTAVLFICELESNELLVKFFGDGCAYSNQEDLHFFNNDEENKPDYLAYQLTDILKSKTAFANYYKQKPSFRTITKDFSITSDGIFTFKESIGSEAKFDYTNYLVKDDFLYQNPASLKRKLNIIKKKGYEHYDDLTIVRIIIE